MLVLAHATGGQVPLISPHVVPLLGIIAAASLYIRATRILASRGRVVPIFQQLCFAAGLALIFCATQTGIDPLGEHHLVSAHMAQHLMLADLPAPLLLVGLRSPVLLFIWPRSFLIFAAHRRLLRAFWSWVRRPVVALTIWFGTLIVWHIPAAYQAALTNPWIHLLEHGTFVVTGIIVWYPILDPLRTGGADLWRAAYLAVARLVGGVLGAILLGSQHVLYPAYGSAPEAYGISPLTDQQIAGAMMMAVDFLYVTIGVLWIISTAGPDSPDAHQVTEQGQADAAPDAVSTRPEPRSSAMTERIAGTADA